MKGIIFNLVEEVVGQAYGAATWDALLEAAQVEGSYTSLGSYPDDELYRLVGAAAGILDLSHEEVVRQVGEHALPLLATRYPAFFEGHSSAQSFLFTLNDIIHPEVRKLYPGADVPDFDFETPRPNVLLLGYRSERQLCALAEGFIFGAATHFGQQVSLDQPSCLIRGDERCVIRCVFLPAEPETLGHEP